MHKFGKCDICNSYGNTDGQVKDIEESVPKSKGEGSTPSRTKAPQSRNLCAVISTKTKRRYTNAYPNFWQRAQLTIHATLN